MRDRIASSPHGRVTAWKSRQNIDSVRGVVERYGAANAPVAA